MGKGVNERNTMSKHSSNLCALAELVRDVVRERRKL